MTKRNILITGASGLVGRRLSSMLLERGYTVAWLSRSERKEKNIKCFCWDLANNFIDPNAIEFADHIIHLAGAGIADARWTASRRREIIDSRVESVNLLQEHLKVSNQQLQSFISASAIGFYGDSGNKKQSEESPNGNGFLAEVCAAWENASSTIEQVASRRVLLRVGIVFSEKDGALVKMTMPLKMGLRVLFGDGKQWYSWIHIDDLCKQFIFALENESITGVYNAVAPNPLPLDELMERIAKTIGAKSIAVKSPVWALKMGMGEMASVLTNSNFVSADKISRAGFEFKYPTIESAFRNLYP